MARGNGSEGPLIMMEEDHDLDRRVIKLEATVYHKDILEEQRHRELTEKVGDVKTELTRQVAEVRTELGELKALGSKVVMALILAMLTGQGLGEGLRMVFSEAQATEQAAP